MIRANLDPSLSNFPDIMLEQEFLKTKESWKENGLVLRKAEQKQEWRNCRKLEKNMVFGMFGLMMGRFYI